MSKYVVDCDKNELKLLSDDFCIKYLQQSGWMHQREKEIYEHGYSDGLDALRFTDGAELYARGLNDAWSAAREIICPKTTDEWIKLGKALNAIPEKAYWVIIEKEPQEVIRILDDYKNPKAENASDTEETQVNKELEAYCYKHTCSSCFMKTKFPKCGNGQNVMFFKGNELEAALKLMQADELLHQQKEKS